MTPARRHIAIVADLGCVIHREFLDEWVSPEVHHIAEGSGKRSDFMTVGLCPECHRGAKGFHNGPKAFLTRYKLPTEYHLLDLVNRFRAQDGT